MLLLSVPGRHRHRRLLGVGAGLTLLLVVLAVAAWSGRWRSTSGVSPGETDPGTRSAWQAPRVLGERPAEIAPGIYLLGQVPLVASYAVKTSQGLVLIDTELEPDAGPLKEQLTLLGLDWHRIRAILLTHVHGDHSGGAQALRAATGAKIYIGKADADVLRAGEPREAFYGSYQYLPRGLRPTPTAPDVEVSDDQIITVDDVSFHAISAPGHTPGSICYLMERDGQRVLFSGDVIWSLSDRERRLLVDRPLGTYAAYMSPRYRGDAASYLATLQRLRAMPAPNLVLPGHPRQDFPPASPLMTQQRWEALLLPGINEMTQLLARYQKDGAGFLDGTPRILAQDLFYLGDIKRVAVYAFFAEGKFYVINAPGDAATNLPDFIDAGMKQLNLRPAVPMAVLIPTGDPEVRGGLPDLLKRHHPAVVMAQDAWEKIEGLFPVSTQVVFADQLFDQHWFMSAAMPLPGRGIGETAFRLFVGGKTALVTGRIPHKQGRAFGNALRRDFASGRADPQAYLATIEQLRMGKPDMWLPSFPADGQNANLYGNDWGEVLDSNANIAKSPKAIDSDDDEPPQPAQAPAPQPSSAQ